MEHVPRTMGTVINVTLVTMEANVRQGAQRTVMEHVTRAMRNVINVTLVTMEANVRQGAQ